ncbi:MAG: xylulokinase [Ponticaulis sp.]|nr:xylulokinase [Ponticaulis sp.]
MFLGIDIGTSGVKTVIIDEKNTVLDSSTTPLSVSRPRPLWSEQSPEDWWQAVEASVLKLSSENRRKVQAIGLSGQMHGAVLLDKSDEVIRPAILWNDGRCREECKALENLEPRSRQITANLIMPGFTAPKLLWVARHEAENFDRIEKVLLPKDYIGFRLTGEFATEMSDASGTMWLDVPERRWSDEMLAACELSRDQMPRLLEGCEIVSTLKQDVAASWGMDGVPVIAGGGDNAAGAVGMGVIDEGSAFVSLGTSGVVFLAGKACHPSPETGVHAFCHALPERWHQMSVMLSAASCLDWAARLTGQSDTGEFVRSAEQNADLTGGEVFLPYLSGERTPHNNPMARGVLFGVDYDTDQAAIAQAVLEGVSFGLADGLSALTEAGGKLENLTVIGGGSRSAYWGRILSAALNMPLSYRQDSEVGPAFGAAKLAHVGLSGEPAEAVCTPPDIISEITPDQNDVDALAEKKDRFRRLYSKLESEFSEQDVS